MILEFSIENYRSIKEMQTISFVAANLKSKNSELDRSNTYPASTDLHLLKSIAVYGANGSGKSNLIKGLFAMLMIMHEVTTDEVVLDEHIQPFYLDEDSHTKPTFFQLQFLMEGKIYRYGFQATKKKIISEWLFGPADKTETYYFERLQGENVRINQKFFPEGKGTKKLKEVILFLNLLNLSSGDLSSRIKKYFEEQIVLSLGIQHFDLRKETLHLLESPNGKKYLLDFLKLADFGLEEVFEEDLDGIYEKLEMPISNSKEKILLGSRYRYDNHGNKLEKFAFPFNLFESEGTKKIFDILGVIINTLKFGGIFIIDEFDARLHPMLTKKIIQMFNSTELNKKGAQLLFVTHDTNLLDNELLRRDQIYFAEKDSFGKTHFYSLYDFKGVRNDASYEKDYINGKYGAIPFLGDFNQLFHE